MWPANTTRRMAAASVGLALSVTLSACSGSDAEGRGDDQPSEPSAASQDLLDCAASLSRFIGVTDFWDDWIDRPGLDLKQVTLESAIDMIQAESDAWLQDPASDACDDDVKVEVGEAVVSLTVANAGFDACKWSGCSNRASNLIWDALDDYSTDLVSLGLLLEDARDAIEPWPATRLDETYVECVDSPRRDAQVESAPGYLELRDAGTTLSIAPPEWGSTGLGIDLAACVLSKIEVPSRVVSLMDSTSAMMGRQEDSWGDFTATWSYHPDSGMNLVLAESAPDD